MLLNVHNQQQVHLQVSLLISFTNCPFTLLLLCLLSAHNLTAVVLEGVFGRDMPHQEDGAPTAPNPSLPR